MVNFPYEKIDGYNLVNLQLPNSLNVNMITTDFVNLSEQDIHPNNVVLDQYYSQNLDYMVLAEIANNPTIYDNLDNNLAKTNNETLTAICTLLAISANGYGWVRGAISYGLAGDRAIDSSSNYYPNLDEANSRRDAYRHILWNSLLTQYYFTISSKVPRLGFAKLVTDARESGVCANSNNADSRQMDYHNNFIGRKIWDDNTTYRKLFGWVVGLNKPSTSDLKDYAFHTVEKVSCFIVKDHPTNTSPSFNYTIQETKQQILNTHQNTAVYFIGPIAPKQPRTTVTNDYSDCAGTGTTSPNELMVFGSQNAGTVAPNDPCIRKVYTTSLVNSCFVSKDINLNPYL